MSCPGVRRVRGLGVGDLILRGRGLGEWVWGFGASWAVWILEDLEGAL